MDGIFPIFIPVSKRLLQGLSTLFYVCISLGSGKAVKIIKMFFRESGVWYNMSGSVCMCVFKYICVIVDLNPHNFKSLIMHICIHTQSIILRLEPYIRLTINFFSEKSKCGINVKKKKNMYATINH